MNVSKIIPFEVRHQYGFDFYFYVFAQKYIIYVLTVFCIFWGKRKNTLNSFKMILFLQFFSVLEKSIPECLFA